MRRLFRSALLLLCVAIGAPAFGSTVYNRTFHSSALDRDWAYTIYLPSGYRADGPRLPVLYLLHGNNGNATDWITQGRLQTTADALIERHEIPPVVIVMPQGGTDWYVDRKEKIEAAGGVGGAPCRRLRRPAVRRACVACAQLSGAMECLYGGAVASSGVHRLRR